MKDAERPTTQSVVKGIPNWKLGTRMKTYLAQHPETHGYLVANHGLYTWGRTIAEARRHVEAFEFLFECEKLLLQCGTAQTAHIAT